MEQFIELGREYLSFLQNAWPGVAALILLGVVWLASGCAAATVAELRRHGPWLHFCGGIVIPIGYPLFVLFVLPRKKEKEAKVKEEKVTHIEGPPPVEQPPVSKIKAHLEPVIEAEEPAFNQAYFKRIASDSEGNLRGPFTFNIGGEQLRVERIVEAMPAAVVIEIVDAQNKAQTIRLPYTRIEGCKEL